MLLLTVGSLAWLQTLTSRQPVPHKPRNQVLQVIVGYNRILGFWIGKWTCCMANLAQLSPNIVSPALNATSTIMIQI